MGTLSVEQSTSLDKVYTTTNMFTESIADLNNCSSCSNETLSNRSNGIRGLPEEMRFGTLQIITVTAYSCFFVIAASGNLTVFITLFRNRNTKSRVNMFIMHLSLADLIVTFIMMPLEIAWHATVEWRAGDAGCRIMMFFRTFGLYLSSFVLVVISLDRYFAILHPLSLNDADKRGKIMLVFAWLFSGVASLPQSIIFHVEAHPDYLWFHQCVTFNFFPTPTHELVYNLFNMAVMYGIPLIIITLSYTLILREISQKTKQSKEELEDINCKTRSRLRRSAVGNIERARARTLKMTIVIVSVFVICWTPYYVIAVWWWFDRESARQLDSKIQKGLFMFAVSNSCMNPIVYGLFTINFKREFRRCCCCVKSKWDRWKYDGYTGNTLTLRDGYQKSTISRGSYSSARTSMTSQAVKVNLDLSVNGEPSVRYSIHMFTNKNKRQRQSIPRIRNHSRSMSTESTVNMNDVVSLKLPKQDHTRTAKNMV